MTLLQCKRCGTCCINGGPVLHHKDLPLITRGIIKTGQLLVIRQDEPAFQPVSSTVEPASCEMLKIQGKTGSWECLFYDPDQKGCTIHHDRPLECRLLYCQNPTDLLAVIGKNCLSRFDIISDTDPTIPFIKTQADHSWKNINNLPAAPAPLQIKQTLEILKADLDLRQQAVNTLHLSLAQELFYLGRPMFQGLNHPALIAGFKDGELHLQPR
jgi:hypothetical protein